MRMMESTLSSVLQSIGLPHISNKPITSDTVLPGSPLTLPLPPHHFPTTLAPAARSSCLASDWVTSGHAESEALYTSDTAFSPSSGLGVPGTTYQSTPDEPPRLHVLPADSLHP